jgi:hypothetical protein
LEGFSGIPTKIVARNTVPGTGRRKKAFHLVQRGGYDVAENVEYEEDLFI